MRDRLGNGPVRALGRGGVIGDVERGSGITPTFVLPHHRVPRKYYFRGVPQGEEIFV